MPNLPPPSGNPAQAEKYIGQLVSLIDNDKLAVLNTDLSKFDPSSLQDHYRIDLKDYQLEVSHSKHPSTGKDSYVLLFTNIKNIVQNNCQKIILAYLHLEDSQFGRFKTACKNQLERERKKEEDKRLKEALQPVDQILANLSTDSADFKYSLS